MEHYQILKKWGKTIKNASEDHRLTTLANRQLNLNGLHEGFQLKLEDGFHPSVM